MLPKQTHNLEKKKKLKGETCRAGNEAKESMHIYKYIENNNKVEGGIKGDQVMLTVDGGGNMEPKMLDVEDEMVEGSFGPKR